MSALFTPLRVGTLELPNRIVIAPMCLYSAVNGCMTDWHLIHLGHLALSGAALLTIINQCLHATSPSHSVYPAGVSTSRRVEGAHDLPSLSPLPDRR
jgi:2,4-dienoyl-CoA reductase-like NADH-dependent reductase (Old Yellow Enzyme family)